VEDDRIQLYLFELRVQAIMLARADRLLTEAGRETGPTQKSPLPDFGMVDATWFALHSILGAAANISKLLWGGDEADREDRKRLRDALEVSDDSVLRFRHVRNKFEHVDEYIDDWVAIARERKEAGEGVNFVSRNVGSKPDQWGPSNEGMMFGHYDPDSKTVWFWEWEVSVADIVREGTAIGARAWELALGRWVQ
jgi:hypothetical protein